MSCHGWIGLKPQCSWMATRLAFMPRCGAPSEIRFETVQAALPHSEPAARLHQSRADLKDLVTGYTSGALRKPEESAPAQTIRPERRTGDTRPSKSRSAPGLDDLAVVVVVIAESVWSKRSRRQNDLDCASLRHKRSLKALENEVRPSLANNYTVNASSPARNAARRLQGDRYGYSNGDIS